MCESEYLCGCVFMHSTLANLDKANNDDESQCQKFGRSKEILHSGGCLHTVAVHKRQQDCE